jgi:putative polyhydroxyalkanoate system protein
MALPERKRFQRSPHTLLMAHIDVSRPHSLGLNGARRAAEDVLDDLRREHQLRLDTRWEGDTLHARGRGFEAWLHAQPQTVRVTAHLGMFLRPFRGAIREEVRRYLDHYLGNGRA